MGRWSTSIRTQKSLQDVDVFLHKPHLLKVIADSPKRSESEYDSFGVGHSPTSIGGALGMAVASQYQVIKINSTLLLLAMVLMTAGQAFEAFKPRRYFK